MTRKQFALILDLYHNYNEAYNSLNENIKMKFNKLIYTPDSHRIWIGE